MKRKPRKSIEEQAADARAKRQEDTAVGVNGVLKGGNCRLAAFVRVGEKQIVPIEQILNLPVVILTISN